MKLQHTLLAGLMLAALIGSTAHAAITAEQAKALGSTLTGVGADKAGNKDGSIPAYDGGLTKPPAGFKAGDGVRPNPYANEKPKFSIDAKNMAQHAGNLTEGTKALLQQYPTMRIDVYPTHRSVAFPKFVTDNTAKTALTANTSNGGRSIEGAHAGFPFPIPKDGYEAMWNHLVRFNGQAYESKYRNLTVDSSGRATLATEGNSVQEYPYWDPSKSSAETYWRMKLSYTAPARRAGEALLLVDPLDIGAKDRRAWSYLPGQRRVKVAPDFSFDTPNPGTAGGNTFDDVFIFNGSMDRYDFKLVGKKEMIVPYNAYAAVYRRQAGRTAEAQLPQPRPGALGAAPRLGGGGDAARGQAPRLQQAHLLPRRGLVGGAGLRRIRRARPDLPRRLRLHGAELRPAGALHRHVQHLRPDRAQLLADRLHRRDRRRQAHQAAGRPRMDRRRAGGRGNPLKRFAQRCRRCPF
jgi:hypothetical protein